MIAYKKPAELYCADCNALLKFKDLPPSSKPNFIQIIKLIHPEGKCSNSNREVEYHSPDVAKYHEPYWEFVVLS